MFYLVGVHDKPNRHVVRQRLDIFFLLNALLLVSIGIYMYNYTNSSTSQVEYLLPAHGECKVFFAKLHENSCDYLLIIIVPHTLVHETTRF